LGSYETGCFKKCGKGWLSSGCNNGRIKIIIIILVQNQFWPFWKRAFEKWTDTRDSCVKRISSDMMAVAVATAVG